MGLSGWELVIVLVIVLLLFGAKRLPDLANSLGRSIKEFRSATADEGDEGDEEDRDVAGDGGGPSDTATS